MEENNSEKISVSGADLLKDVVADERQQRPLQRIQKRIKKIKTKRKIKKRKRQRTAKSSMPKSSSMEQWQQCSPAFLSLCLS